MIIAIDGPAGSGKSTVAKEVAQALNLMYLDTGAMYRAITFFCLDNNIDVNDEVAVNNSLKDINMELIEGNFVLNNNVLGSNIRTKIVTSNVSVIASYKNVREKLVELQRELSTKSDSILDGRDIGTVVFPNADFKFYLEADSMVRAMRRFEEVKCVQTITLEELHKDIVKRDTLDSTREISPLSKASDAITIDTSYMNIEEVVQKIIENVS